MNIEKTAELRDKIMQGLKLACQRMLIEKQKDDREIVFSHGGKIVKIKAREIKDVNDFLDK